MEKSYYKPFRPVLLLIVWMWLAILAGSRQGEVLAQGAPVFPGAFLGVEDGFQVAVFYSGDVQGNFLPCG